MGILLQVFDFEVKDRKGIENQGVDHVFNFKEEVMLPLGGGTENDDLFSYK